LNCQDFREDLEVYALGALDDREARRIEAHLETCADCSSIVHAHRQAVDYLALAVPLYHASPRVKERILGGIGVIRETTVRLPFRSRWLAGAAAAVLAAIAVGGVAWAVMLSSEVNQLRQDNQALAELTQLNEEQRAALLKFQNDLNFARFQQRELSTTLEEQATLLVIALDPDLIPTELEGTVLAPTSKCSYVWSSKQDVGALTCKDLPNTSFMIQYEFWATKGDKTIPLGSFLPTLEGVAQLLVKFPEDTPGPITNMFVTLERSRTARTQPSNEVILQRSPAQQATR
jgi:anti-sigma-K factor RskA